MLKGRSDVVGPALRRALTEQADRWLSNLFGSPGPGVALVAVGGYGRSEPAFASDLDLVLLHDGRRGDVSGLADALWYPVWDSGIGLDHSVRTLDQAVSVFDADLKAALGMLDARLVCGDGDLVATLLSTVRDRWRAKAAKRLPEMAAGVAQRAAAHGEVAFLLEPDLKESRGGLRDVGALRALAVAQIVDPPSGRVQDAAQLLLDVRGELHRRSGRGRSADRLDMADQAGIGAVLGMGSGPDAADLLAHQVASAGRLIAWTWDSTWHRAARSLRPRRWRGRVARRPLDEGVVEHDGEVVLAVSAQPTHDPALAWRAARAAAQHGLSLSPHTVERLVAEGARPPVPWTSGLREAFVGLLAAGPPAIPVLEAMDQAGLLERLLPVWSSVRSRPQRNPYHRFTVDRHLLECAVQAAGLTRQVRRPDLLLLGALLHDVGKGQAGDHSEVGVAMVAEIAPRMGLVPADVATLEALVRHHLLLPDVATRRDLDDPSTIARVADAVVDEGTLELLAALAEADGLATGPTAWTPWKARLIADLTRRVASALGGRVPEPPALTSEEDDLLTVDAAGTGDGLDVAVGPDTDGAVVLVTGPDRPGLLAAITGVVALHRLDIRRASARSRTGRAVTELLVTPRHGDDLPTEERLLHDLEAVLGGRVDATTTLRSRSTAYATNRRGPRAAPPEVHFFDDAASATVVEVRAPDDVGVLHRVVSALTGCGLDVHTALASTLGLDVVDSFYVSWAGGGELTGREQRSRVREAVLEALAPAGVEQLTGR